jgi:hypothetical protein
MMYVDEMQSVNNSFTNLASQLGAYKKGKLEYAQAMQEGLYSNGNPSSQSKEAAIIYGFYDSDGDGRSEDRYDAPFQIQDGGNIAFNVGGKEITYNGMEEPFLKDTKFLNALSKTAETAYNSGASGKSNSKYAQDAYKQELDDSLQNEDTLRSIIFDFKAEADLKSIGDALESGAIDIQGAREQVIVALTQAREDAYNEGKLEYDKKEYKLSPSEQQTLKVVTDKTKLLDAGTMVSGRGSAGSKRVKLIDGKYLQVDQYGIELNNDALSKAQVVELLNLNVRGLNWK